MERGEEKRNVPKGKSPELPAISIMELLRLNGKWKRVVLVRGGLRRVLVLRLHAYNMLL
jgi:hypothetical protein